MAELGYVDMFTDMFNHIDERGLAPGDVLRRLRRQRRHGRRVPVREERRLGAVDLFDWRGGATPRITASGERYEGYVVIKREVLPDGRVKMILKDPATGDYVDRVIAGA